MEGTDFVFEDVDFDDDAIACVRGVGGGVKAFHDGGRDGCEKL